MVTCENLLPQANPAVPRGLSGWCSFTVIQLEVFGVKVSLKITVCGCWGSSSYISDGWAMVVPRRPESQAVSSLSGFPLSSSYSTKWIKDLLEKKCLQDPNTIVLSQVPRPRTLCDFQWFSSSQSRVDSYILGSELQGIFEIWVKPVPQVVDNETEAKCIDWLGPLKPFHILWDEDDTTIWQGETENPLKYFSLKGSISSEKWYNVGFAILLLEASAAYFVLVV